jgi:hypothetical protein
MSWVESQLLYRMIDANREQCVTCGASFYWWEMWMGQCDFCEGETKPKDDDAKTPPDPPQAPAARGADTSPPDEAA